MFGQLSLAGRNGPRIIRPQNVFATTPYTGTGANQTIANGLDLAGRGGLVWAKGRGDAFDHALFDTARGASQQLNSNYTSAERPSSDFLSFSANGFEVGSPNLTNNLNNRGSTYVAQSFCRAPRFFDIVRYRGDGTSARLIEHGLKVSPGLIIAKSSTASGDWYVYHRSIGPDYHMILNTSRERAASTAWGKTYPTGSTFAVGGSANLNGTDYVAYIFAHDPDPANGLIQCGSYFTNSSSSATVNLGWQPQFLLLKNYEQWGNYSNFYWFMRDAARGNNGLYANVPDAEKPKDGITITSTGFLDYGYSNSNVWISYLAIRAPF